MAHETLLRANDTVLVVIDVQEKLLPVMHDPDRVSRACGILLQGVQHVGVPVIVTEQYPKGLGHTVADVSAHFGDATVLEKVSFSCAGNESFLDFLEERNRDQVLLAGIETHVCVLQTALDLIDEGMQVHVAADACSSRNPEHHKMALDRMRSAGAIITNTESALFEMCAIAQGDAFKAISRLVR